MSEQSAFTCYFCRGQQARGVSQRDAKSGQKLVVMQCQGCSLVQQYPLPSDSELANYYANEYREDYKGVHRPKPKHVHRAGVTALNRLQFLASAGLQSGRLTDIGAGGGEFVFLAEQSGFDAQGLEPHKGYSAFAREHYGASIETGSIDQLEQNSADVITIFHVLEHLVNPKQAINTMADALTDGGHLFIEVPDIETADASPDNIYFSAHLFYFGVATLVSMAHERFELIQSDTESNLRVLLRKRATPSTLEMPSQAAIQHAIERVSNKGWQEYLFKTQAWSKPLRRLNRYRAETQMSQLSPRVILENLFKIQAQASRRVH